jgi:hypothetical protein
MLETDNRGAAKRVSTYVRCSVLGVGVGIWYSAFGVPYPSRLTLCALREGGQLICTHFRSSTVSAQEVTIIERFCATSYVPLRPVHIKELSPSEIIKLDTYLWVVLEIITISKNSVQKTFGFIKEKHTQNTEPSNDRVR